MDNSLFLNDQEFMQLDQIIGELPTRYGLKLVSFFQLVKQKRNAEAQMAESQAKIPDVNTFKESALKSLEKSIDAKKLTGTEDYKQYVGEGPGNSDLV